jgi:hypothetical protein
MGGWVGEWGPPPPPPRDEGVNPFSVRLSPFWLLFAVRLSLPYLLRS